MSAEQHMLLAGCKGRLTPEVGSAHGRGRSQEGAVDDDEEREPGVKVRAQQRDLDILHGGAHLLCKYRLLHQSSLATVSQSILSQHAHNTSHHLDNTSMDCMHVGAAALPALQRRMCRAYYDTGTLQISDLVHADHMEEVVGERRSKAGDLARVHEQRVGLRRRKQ